MWLLELAMALFCSSFAFSTSNSTSELSSLGELELYHSETASPSVVRLEQGRCSRDLVNLAYI